MADQNDSKLVSVDRELLQRVKGGASTTASTGLWIKEPEAQDDDRTKLAARLCSCDNVCLAVMEDNG
ncbi:MAG TPA: hypothetical protein VF789_29275 [Thermoanaerobaculia bacterium]